MLLFFLSIDSLNSFQSLPKFDGKRILTAQNRVAISQLLLWTGLRSMPVQYDCLENCLLSGLQPTANRGGCLDRC